MKLINNFKKRFLNKLFSSVKNRTYIQNSSDIKLVSKNLSNEIEIGVDTEFTWRKTYFPILSLIQISTPNTLFILDCLSLKNDILYLREIFEDETIIKIFHSLRGDISVLKSSYNFQIKNIYDTQIAENQILEKEIQIGYKDLVKKYLNKNILKSETKSNWGKRPLNEKQIEYAFNDVEHLIKIKQIQSKILENNNKISNTYFLFEKEKKIAEKDFADLRIDRFLNKNKKATSLELDIFKWRENTAKKENIPPNEIFQEKNLKKISSVVNERKIKEFLWLIKEEIYREKFMEKFL